MAGKSRSSQGPQDKMNNKGAAAVKVDSNEHVPTLPTAYQGTYAYASSSKWLIYQAVRGGLHELVMRSKFKNAYPVERMKKDRTMREANVRFHLALIELAHEDDDRQPGDRAIMIGACKDGFLATYGVPAETFEQAPDLIMSIAEARADLYYLPKYINHPRQDVIGKMREATDDMLRMYAAAGGPNCVGGNLYIEFALYKDLDRELPEEDRTFYD